MALSIEYFGECGKELFGIFDLPDVLQPIDCGIVLCYPLLGEYVRSHRCYRQLANRLAQAGFPVLRFDYLGSGDSAGELEDGGVSQWLEDISRAATAMKRRTGVTKVSLVGLRFGANLALLAGAQRETIEHLVLWEPVAQTATYLKELAEAHATLHKLAQPPGVGDLLAAGDGIAGFPVSAGFLDELRSVELLQIQRPPARNLLIIENREAEVTGYWPTRFKALPMPCQHWNIPAPHIWREDVPALIPMPVIQSLVSWFSEVAR
jgi:pimeloyl-ACP methyl ester carboxylesterase